MISFNNLGKMGRLGNQMFQYASLKGIAKKHNYEFSIPNYHNLNNCFHIKPTRPNDNYHSIILEKFEFDEDFFNTCPDNVDIIGYFQTEKYFKHIEQEIKTDFKFKEDIIKKCISQKPESELISLHIRRGDYLTDPNFELMPLSYYSNALRLLPKYKVMVFSDDIEWCRNILKGERFLFSNLSSYEDLCMMTLCDYHIIANSSFSWWGSWLSNSKQTIAPKKWFCGKYSNWNTRDLYLPNWIIL